MVKFNNKYRNIKVKISVIDTKSRMAYTDKSESLIEGQRLESILRGVGK
jgi:hypothetical protein